MSQSADSPDPNIVVKKRDEKLNTVAGEAGHFDDPFFDDMYDFVAKFEPGSKGASPEVIAKRDEINEYLNKVRMGNKADMTAANLAKSGQRGTVFEGGQGTALTQPSIIKAKTTKEEDENLLGM